MLNSTTPLPVVVTLELEGMARTIKQSFADYQEDVDKAVSAQLESIVKEFNFEDQIERSARVFLSIYIDNAVKNYFQIGPGHKILTDMVNKTLENLNKEETCPTQISMQLE